MQTSREEMNSGQLTSYCAQTVHAKQVVAVKYYSKTLKQLFGRCYANSPHVVFVVVDRLSPACTTVMLQSNKGSLSWKCSVGQVGSNGLESASRVGGGYRAKQFNEKTLIHNQPDTISDNNKQASIKDDDNRLQHLRTTTTGQQWYYETTRKEKEEGIKHYFYYVFNPFITKKLLLLSISLTYS